jgi:vacuolar-type H+-ATPase subunit E/Vma4
VVRVASLPSDTMGGVLVSLEDGTQSYNNLLDARFLVVKRNVAFDVNKTLFGEETE